MGQSSSNDNQNTSIQLGEEDAASRDRTESFVGTRLRRMGSSDSSSDEHSWVLVKAKTRKHNTDKTVRKIMWFEAKDDHLLKIGRGDVCDMKLDDERCSKLGALIESKNREVMVSPQARMYRLVGMGSKRYGGRYALNLGTVIKVGSVSLEVINLCTNETDDFEERFAEEIRRPVLKSHASSGGDDLSAIVLTETDVSEENMGSPRDSDSEIVSKMLSIDDDEDADLNDDDDDELCYICWGGRLPEVPNVYSADVIDPASRNPLIQNPCGKCSGSSKHVHLNCLLKWIKSSGSGHCSICNGALPQRFSCPPPNIELKVVRHRRGQSWVGTRRYRLSFVEKDVAIIGRDAGADVRLSDRSIGVHHARIMFDKDSKQFFLSDCSSLGGTFVQVTNNVQLKTDDPVYLKIGRTLLTVRMTRKKSTLLNMIQNPLSWGRN